VLGRDLDDRRVLEGAAVVPVAVERDPTDRRPGLGDDAVGGIECLHLGLLEVGVHLDLIDGRHHLRGREQRLEVAGHEVADADGPDLAPRVQLLQGSVGLQGAVELRGQRLVQEQQVDHVDAELVCALVEGVQGGVVAVVADPDLGLDEDL
jgi:hypothetical protein